MHIDHTEGVAANVKAQALARNFTTASLASRIGLPYESLSRRLRAITPFKPNELARIATVMGITVAQLAFNGNLAPVENSVRETTDATTQLIALAWERYKRAADVAGLPVETWELIPGDFAQGQAWHIQGVHVPSLTGRHPGYVGLVEREVHTALTVGAATLETVNTLRGRTQDTN